MLSSDLYSLGPDFKIPIFFFQGAEDERTPAPLAKEYFEWINAPHKGFVLFDGAGHFAALSMPDRFCRSWSLASVQSRYNHSYGVNR